MKRRGVMLAIPQSTSSALSGSEGVISVKLLLDKIVGRQL
jgi:hypothetical protein